jgi:hypothetical protein
VWVVAAYVVEYLVQGAIAYVGGQLMASALGGATITDVRTWIREAVAELEGFISAKLDEKTIEDMTADLDGVRKSLREYSALSKGKQRENRFLIENADISTGRLTSLALKYDQAFLILVTGMAYRFFALFALYKLDKDAGHITQAKDEVDDFLLKMNDMYGRLHAKLAPSLRIRVDCYMDPGSPGQSGQTGHMPDGFNACDVYLDGVSVNSFYSDYLDGAEKIASQKFVESLIPVLKQAEQDHEDKCMGFLRNLILCYDGMLKAVHAGPYTAPITLPAPRPKPTTMMPPGIMLMPGAIAVGFGH